MKIRIEDRQGRRGLEIDAQGIPKPGEKLDIYEYLPVNERLRFRQVTVLECWWVPNKTRTLCPRLVVEFGPLDQKTAPNFVR